MISAPSSARPSQGPPNGVARSAPPRPTATPTTASPPSRSASRPRVPNVNPNRVAPVDAGGAPPGTRAGPAGADAATGLSQALDDLRALAQLARGRRGIVRPAEHLPELLLHASPRYARALVDGVYGPLTGELARTLAALVEHGFASRRPPPRSRSTATRSTTARRRSS